jgi:hypothetical protein
VLYGGRLGTNLVELGFVELDLLADYLSELSGLPVATPAMLDAAPVEALELVGPELAYDLGVVPVGATEDGTLAVAMIDPADADAIATLQERAKTAITPLVVPELRGLYYLEKLYGLPRKARFIRAGVRRSSQPADERYGRTSISLAHSHQGSSSPVAGERRRTQPPGGLVMPPPATVAPRRRRNTNTQMSVPPPTTTAPVLTYTQACEKIDAATHREQIADAIVEFGRGRFDCVAIFIVRDGNALGWRAHLAGTRPATPVEEMSLPLGGVSALQAAHDELRPFQGVPPSPGKPVESQLWSLLGIDPPPQEILVAPVTVKQRVVNLVYAHGAGGGALPVDGTKQLCDLAVRTQSAYVRLIRSSK